MLSSVTDWRKSILSTVLAVALLFPIASAYAESFTVSANKDLFSVGEKAIIVGIIPDSAPEGYAVLLRVTGPDGTECGVQNVLPDSDNSFVSRPFNIVDCGTGQYAVMAYYSTLASNSTFVVSNSSQTSQGNRLELRLLRNVAIQAQETVNQKLRDFLESNAALPEDIADKYSLGVFEASLVLQAVDFGDTAEAKKHLIFTVKHFREVVDSMAAERVIFEQAINLQAASYDNNSNNSSEEILERYERIKEFYFRLEELSQKNGMDNESKFGTIVSLLARSKQMIDENNVEQAGKDLDEANGMLESIRQSLYNHDSAPGSQNSTERQADVQAKKLSSVADRFERTAYSILKDNPSESVNATIQGALRLISSARVAIDSGDYGSARSSLSAAFSALDDAKEMAKHGASGEGGDDGRSNGQDDKGSSNQGSNNNDDDEVESDSASDSDKGPGNSGSDKDGQ